MSLAKYTQMICKQDAVSPAEKNMLNCVLQNSILLKALCYSGFYIHIYHVTC